MIAKIIRYLLISFSVLGTLLIGYDIFAFGAKPFWVVWPSEAFLILNAIYLILMAWRPSFAEVDAAARVLHQVGTHHHWWKPYVKSYDEMAASDPIAKSEFDGIVERMLMAARKARIGK